MLLPSWEGPVGRSGRGPVCALGKQSPALAAVHNVSMGELTMHAKHIQALFLEYEQRDGSTAALETRPLCSYTLSPRQEK